MQVVKGDVLLVAGADVAAGEVELRRAEAQGFAVVAVGAAAACELQAVAAFQPLLFAEQPFAVASVRRTDVAVPAQAQAVAVKVGGVVGFDADELVDLSQDGDAGLQAQVAVRQVGGVAAVAVAVGEGGADEVDAAVEEWRVVDARVQGGAVPGRLTVVGADVDVDVRLAAEVAALIVVKLQVNTVCAQAMCFGAVEEGVQLCVNLRREERRRKDGDDEPDDGEKGKEAFDHGVGGHPLRVVEALV